MNNIVVSSRKAGKMHIIAVVNKKGGVTKTQTTINVASAFALMGKRVLVCDGDAQCNTTDMLIRGKTILKTNELSPSMYDFLTDKKGKIPLRRLIRARTRQEGIHLIPSSVDMDNIDVALSNDSVWITAIGSRRKEIEELGYDVVVIDTPPGSHKIKSMALYGADLAILPVIPSHMALDGLSDALDELEEIEKVFGRDIMYKILFGRVKYRGDTVIKSSQKIGDELSSALGDKVFNTYIPENDIVINSEKWGKSVLTYAPNSNVAYAYVSLIKEIQTCLS